jgi:putative ATP-dependent endonuclease of the OLD family
VFISEIRIENFRLIGQGMNACVLSLKPGLTAIVGENDAGKTAVIDALRIVLGTRDQELVRIEPTDFHQQVNTSGTSERAEQITIRLIFSDLTPADKSAFAEYLTYVPAEAGVEMSLILTCVAKRTYKEGTSRWPISIEWRTGVDGDGPLLEPGARSLITATYLRPLRDAERAMGAGRGSRLSQILQHTKQIKESGAPFDKVNNPTPDPRSLSVLGLGDYANHLFGENESIRETRRKLNSEYLAPLSFAHDLLNARIGVSGSKDDSIRLRQLLEKLEVVLAEADDAEDAHTRGLGSNNVLFMACELLLLATESDGFPILLIEEPEAHLHPQRQLRLMSFLQDQAAKRRADGQQIQIIVTSHSPNLASEIRLDNLVLLQGRRAFPLSSTKTCLSTSDYRFLERFLDVTKSNLFFARGVMIVEGDAENILLPVIARLLGRDFREHGVSVVNVGGVGLSRYAKIFMREDPAKDGQIEIPVACITDMDVMPDCAPRIVGILEAGAPVPILGQGTKRKWRMKSDFAPDELAKLRQEKRNRASGQRVRSFVADGWTLEYDLAFFGLGEEVWLAIEYALSDDKLNSGNLTRDEAKVAAIASHRALVDSALPKDEYASHVYARLEARGVSKAVTAQYLSDILESRIEAQELTPQELRKRLPPYLLEAIAHVTCAWPAGSPPADNTAGKVP